MRLRVSRIGYKNQSLASIDALCCGALHLQMPSWHQALIAFTKSGGYSAFGFDIISKIVQLTLIWWGDSDKILGTRDAIRFKRAIPHSTLTWIPDCGHLPHLEQPQITAQHILDFRV